MDNKKNDKKKQKTYTNGDEFFNDDGMSEDEKIELTELIWKELEEQEMER